MTTISIPRSKDAHLSEGDLNCGRGQFGFTAFANLVGNVNDLWSLTTPNKPHFYVLDAANDASVQLPTIGTGSTEANPGHRVNIFNNSGSSDITIQDASSNTLFVLSPTLTVIFIARLAPNTWECTCASLSPATLQTAYNAGNTIDESLNREVFIQDNAGFNPNIFEIQDSNGNSIVKVGNSSGGVDSPFVSLGTSNISNQQEAIYSNSTQTPYASIASDANSQVEILLQKKELYNANANPLGTSPSSTVRETTEYNISTVSSGPTSIFYTGQYGSLYKVVLDILYKDGSESCTTVLKFNMRTFAPMTPNVLSSLLQENEIPVTITVDPAYTLLANGDNGFELQITGPDYNPPGLKTFDTRILCTVVAFTV